MKELIKYIAQALVDNPEQVKVEEVEGRHTSILKLKVAKEAMGKVIGKKGATAQAMQDILRAASAKAKRRTVLEILELRRTQMNIYVGNLPFDLTEDELRELFNKIGTVTAVTIIKDRNTSRSKGFGFVVMPEQSEAEQAVKKLNGMLLNGRNIKVSRAHPRKERPKSRFRY